MPFLPTAGDIAVSGGWSSLVRKIERFRKRLSRYPTRDVLPGIGDALRTQAFMREHADRLIFFRLFSVCTR